MKRLRRSDSCRPGFWLWFRDFESIKLGMGVNNERHRRRADQESRGNQSGHPQSVLPFDPGRKRYPNGHSTAMGLS